jgi:hypothetical protein
VLDSRPFTNIIVQPAYGYNHAVLRWSVSKDYRDWGALVYRSPDGLTSWELLNADEEPVFTTEFLDTDLPPAARLDRVHYRINLEQPITGVTIEGPLLAFYEQLSPSDYQRASLMIRAELKRISRGPGIPMFHYVPLTRGTVNPFYDKVTWLQSGSECKCNPDQSYGMPFVGGFGPPLQTWVHLVDVQRSREWKEDATGTKDSSRATARLLSFPHPSLGHMLVHPATDDRYVVAAGEVKPFLYRGMVQIGFEVTLILLRRTDSRYQVPVPTLDKTLALPDYR